MLLRINSVKTLNSIELATGEIDNVIEKFSNYMLIKLHCLNTIDKHLLKK